MPKVKMIETTKGSPNGIQVNYYQAGREYDLPDSLAKAFISMGVASYIKIKRKDVGGSPANKAIELAPANKAIELAPANKIPEKEEISEVIQEPKKQVNEKIKTTRVYQLADELSIPSKEIIKIAKKLGIFVSRATSGLSEEEEERIKLVAGEENG